jgi:hypothetical protein
VDHAAQDVAPHLVGAEQVGRLAPLRPYRRGEAADQALAGRLVRSHVRREDRSADDGQEDQRARDRGRVARELAPDPRALRGVAEAGRGVHGRREGADGHGAQRTRICGFR